MLGFSYRALLLRFALKTSRLPLAAGSESWVASSCQTTWRPPGVIVFVSLPVRPEREVKVRATTSLPPGVVAMKGWDVVRLPFLAFFAFKAPSDMTSRSVVRFAVHSRYVIFVLAKVSHGRFDLAIEGFATMTSFFPSSFWPTAV